MICETYILLSQEESQFQTTYVTRNGLIFNSLAGAYFMSIIVTGCTCKIIIVLLKARLSKCHFSRHPPHPLLPGGPRGHLQRSPVRAEPLPCPPSRHPALHSDRLAHPLPGAEERAALHQEPLKRGRLVQGLRLVLRRRAGHH